MSDRTTVILEAGVGGVLALPYHRVYRPCRKAPNSGYNSWIYLTDHEYAKLPINYTHPFLSLQKDIENLFEYVAPADKNLKTYSYRIQQLLIRVCVEIEANFKAIFKENHFTRKDESQWNINVTIQFRPSCNQTKNPEVIPGIFCIGMAEVV